ncbi:MAG TPA: ABC transporter permease, partial [Candidatus Sumerlaeota bacterium]|nr:ABC transporter permease [Candidatus Sumerlaeota bacterium]
RLVNLDFVSAVKALGGSDARIIFLHILPNALGPILVMVSFGIAGSILVESSLSFLGFGVPQPTASWGDILNNGRNDIQGTWWLTVFPGLAIFLTVTCFNLVGEGFRDALDPQRER